MINLYYYRILLGFVFCAYYFNSSIDLFIRKKMPKLIHTTLVHIIKKKYFTTHNSAVFSTTLITLLIVFIFYIYTIYIFYIIYKICLYYFIFLFV